MHTRVQDILEADIKRRIRERSKRHPLLARNVLRTRVLIPYRILDLHTVSSCHSLPLAPSHTHMNVNLHSIALMPANGRRDHNQRVPRDKVTDAPLALGIMPLHSHKVEVQRLGAGEQQRKPAQHAQY